MLSGHKNDRPFIQILSDSIIKQIVAEAIEILEHTGVEVADEKVLAIMGDNGVRIERAQNRAFIPNSLVEKSLKTVPSSITLYNRSGEIDVTLENNNSFFTPLAGAINVWDSERGKVREPVTKDCLDFIKITDALKNIKIQSSTHYPVDVHEKLAPVYRLYLCLRYGVKPCWGTMIPTTKNVEIAKELLLAIRGNHKALKEKPLLFFSCTPISPLQWGKEPLNILIEASNNNIPVVIASSPSIGATSPIFLISCITQIVAEIFSGIVISQIFNPGAKVIFGSAPEIMDMRNASTAMGAIESTMVNIACTEIAKYLNISNFIVTGVSDAKRPDAQSGLETGIGMLLGALAGANIVVGPGGMSQCLVSSLEKLVIDNEICGMAYRLLWGINDQKNTKLAEDLFNENLFQIKNFLSTENTLKHFKSELFYPGNVISREGLEEWQKVGCSSTETKARIEVAKILEKHELERLDKDAANEMIKIIKQHAKSFSVTSLPDIDL
jgi:trimethylamine--corrinoid protein Co-methyltransferase